MKFNQYFFFNELHTKRQFAGKRNVSYELNLGLMDIYMFWYSLNKASYKRCSKYLYNNNKNKILSSTYLPVGQRTLHIVYFVECH